MLGRKRQIKWIPIANAEIRQIYSRGIEYALVSDNYEQCHCFVWCKDFLHDVIHSCLNARKFEIYRFNYNPRINPRPCMSKIRLLLTNAKDKTFSEKIPACLDFINQVEDRLKIKKSFVRECGNPPTSYKKSGVFLFEGSKRWLQAPPMISLYSLLLRVGFSHKMGNSFSETINQIKLKIIKPYQKYDRTWLEEIDPALEKIFRLGDRRIFSRNIKENYPNQLVIDTIHNRLGIIGFSSDIVYKILGKPVVVPCWHYLK